VRETPDARAGDKGGTTMRTPVATTAAAGGLLLAVVTGGAPAVAGVSGPAFYVDGSLYRTVGTPTDLSRTGAPAHAWDLIYDFGGFQPNVATAAPGDRDFNGGRWMVHALVFPDGYAAALASADTDGDDVIDSDTELALALTAGTAVDVGVVKQFECPVIPLPGRR
jgi:hypothetical protein